MPILPHSHPPQQNLANKGADKNKVNPTHVCDQPDAQPCVLFQQLIQVTTHRETHPVILVKVRSLLPSRFVLPAGLDVAVAPVASAANVIAVAVHLRDSNPINSLFNLRYESDLLILMKYI